MIVVKMITKFITLLSLLPDFNFRFLAHLIFPTGNRKGRKRGGGSDIVFSIVNMTANGQKKETEEFKL